MMLFKDLWLCSILSDKQKHLFHRSAEVTEYQQKNQKTDQSCYALLPLLLVFKGNSWHFSLMVSSTDSGQWLPYKCRVAESNSILSVTPSNLLSHTLTHTHMHARSDLRLWCSSSCVFWQQKPLDRLCFCLFSYNVPAFLCVAFSWREVVGGGKKHNIIEILAHCKSNVIIVERMFRFCTQLRSAWSWDHSQILNEDAQLPLNYACLCWNAITALFYFIL